MVDLFKSDTSSNFDELYITQELMDADLCHIIQSKYPISEEHIKRFLYQLLRGLKAMHSANVLHRDLKPGNILWKNNGELKICDFGLARGMAEPVDGCDISMTNYVATRWYRPPEILLYRAQYGKSLDMWSVGCIVAELFGRKVFLPGSSAMDQFHMIVQKLGTPSPEAIAAIPSLRSRQYVERLCKYPRIEFKERFPNISAPGLDLLERMLAFDPNQRITVTAALAHPYMAAYHDPAQEPTLPVFDFSFEARCHDLADIKSEIMAELALYHQPSPGLGCALKPAPADPRDPTLHRHRQLSAPGLAPNSHAEQPAPPKKPAGSFLAGLPPLIKRRFSMPARNLKPGPNSSA